MKLTKYTRRSHSLMFTASTVGVFAFVSLAAFAVAVCTWLAFVWCLMRASRHVDDVEIPQAKARCHGA